MQNTFGANITFRVYQNRYLLFEPVFVEVNKQKLTRKRYRTTAVEKYTGIENKPGTNHRLGMLRETRLRKFVCAIIEYTWRNNAVMVCLPLRSSAFSRRIEEITRTVYWLKKNVEIRSAKT